VRATDHGALTVIGALRPNCPFTFFLLYSPGTDHRQSPVIGGTGSYPTTEDHEFARTGGPRQTIQNVF